MEGMGMDKTLADTIIKIALLTFVAFIIWMGNRK